jgi:lipopolysaccharide export system permease protein
LSGIIRVKTLHRYLLRQIIATLLMTALVFTFVLLLGNALKEILPLLMSQKASAGRIAQAFGLLIPFVGVDALPMGMLTATLLVFGRFSADQELTAARASGISLVSLVTPIIILSLLLCAISAVVNLEMGPRSRVAFKQLLFNLTANLATLQLPEGRPITIKGEPPGSFTISVGKNRRQTLENVHLIEVEHETNLVMIATAPRGKIEVDATNQVVFLHLYETQVIYVAADDTPFSGDVVFRLDLSSARREKVGITDMTFLDLREELRRLEQTLGLPLPIGKSSPEEAVRKKRAVKKQAEDLTEPYRVQIHRRVAFSFACFGFTLVGIPLGIRVHRRETNVGIGMALFLVAVYYGLLIVAQSLTSRPEFAPHLLIWMPNFVFQAVGVVLLWRANKGI